MWSEETHRGVRTLRWSNELKATNPAKHGSRDWLVSFNGVVWDDYSIQPTQTAMIAGAGLMAQAQRDCFGCDELFIGDWMSRAMDARGIPELKDIVDQHHRVWELRRAGRFG